MRAISTNYGLRGGTLDATKHLKAAIPRLLNGSEQDRARNLFVGVVEKSVKRNNPTTS